MSVPDFQTMMRPLLELTEDGNSHEISSIRTALASEFELSEEDIAERIPSGRVTTLQNRVGWAATYLYRCGLLERPERAKYRITERGRQVLADNPDRVDMAVLSQFDEYESFKKGAGKSSSAGSKSKEIDTSDEDTPEEQMEKAFNKLESALKTEVLDRVREQSWQFFEDLVLDVMTAMGYGGPAGVVERLGQSGDEGVDGVIREDPLGLDLVYVQAKKWAHNVQRPEIQKFFGALHGKRASKGVFITTSGFSPSAREFAEGATPRIILVDGDELAELMVRHGVGVTTQHTYELRRLDLDYFIQAEDE